MSQCGRQDGDRSSCQNSWIIADYASFFFQAEDGIRDGHVTGVQTCALPIYMQDHSHLCPLQEFHINARFLQQLFLLLTKSDFPKTIFEHLLDRKSVV